MPGRDVNYGIEVGGTAERMYYDNGARPGRDGAGHALGRQVERAWVDVRKDRRGPPIKNGMRDGDESERRENHFIAFTDAEGGQTEVQSGRAGRQGHGVRLLRIPPTSGRG